MLPSQRTRERLRSETRAFFANFQTLKDARKPAKQTSEMNQKSARPLLPNRTPSEVSPWSRTLRHGAGFFGRHATSLRLKWTLGPCFADAECLAIVIVGEEFGIAAPADDGAQSLLRVARVQMIFELGLEPYSGCEMALAFIEDMADMRCERDKLDQMLAEQPFALVRRALREHPPCRGAA